MEEIKVKFTEIYQKMLSNTEDDSSKQALQIIKQLYDYFLQNKELLNSITKMNFNELMDKIFNTE